MRGMSAIYNGFPVPNGMAITSPEFSDYLWEQAQQGDEKAVQAILGSEKKMAPRAPWTIEFEQRILDIAAAMPGPPSRERIIEAARQAYIERYPEENPDD